VTVLGLLPGFVLLQAEAPPGGSPFGMLAPMAIIFVIFYVLLIRPQQKRQREQEQMLKSIEKGDEVVTAGGLHGKVVGVTDETLTLEIAAVKGERVRVKVSRARVESRIRAGKGQDS
jgi:preprotein translocase subunit YajC